MISKIAEATCGRSLRTVPVALGALETIRSQLVNLKGALERRGIFQASDFWRYEYEQIEYPLGELEKFLNYDPECRLNEHDTYIFAFFVRHKIRDLERGAAEVDEKYQREVGPASA